MRPPSDEPPRPVWAGAGLSPIGPVDPGLQLFDEQPSVAPALAAAHAVVAGGRVLGHAAQAGVGDADEDDGFGFAGSR